MADAYRGQTILVLGGGIDVVIGDIEAIDPATRTATIDGPELTADHLVVALGAEQVPEVIPGMTEVGHTFATLSGARRLGIELDAIDHGRILVLTAGPVYRCPAAPYEAACLIDAPVRKRGVGARVEVAVHSAVPMGVAGVNVADAVMGLLAAKGISYRPSHQIASVEPGQAVFYDGQTEAFDLLAYMPPIAAPPVIARSALAGPGGWIEVDRETLRTGYENAYAIGDTVQMLLCIGKPLPRAGIFAHGEGKVVADTIIASITGKPSTARFDVHGGCFIEVGDGRAGYGSGDFYAEPSPSIRVRPPARRWHLGKVAFEQEVMHRWL